jgi:predicted component of type VI protein secretion system
MQLAMRRDMGVKDPNSLNAMVARNTHAVLNTSSVLDQIRTLKRLVIVLSFLMAFGAICMVTVLLR